MQTKIRSTIIAFVAAFSFAATMAPAAQAQPNDGGFQHSSEARCNSLANLFASDLVAAHRAGANGDPATRDEYRERGSRDFAYAQKAGCGWAA